MTYDTACQVDSTFGMKTSSKREVGSPAKNELSSDIYSNATVAKKSEPKIVAQSLPNIDKTIGFNPYDTGVLQQQKIKN